MTSPQLPAVVEPARLTAALRRGGVLDAGAVREVKVLHQRDTVVSHIIRLGLRYVGESTGALPTMLNSVAEFFEEDVNTRMTAALALIEPAIMMVMGGFVAFVLIALYLPIFSLADTIH